MSLDQTIFQSIVSGRATVTTAGTAVQLNTARTDILAIDIMAETDNTGFIAVGDVNVVAAEGTQQGIVLSAGQSYTFNVTNRALIYIDSTIDGEGVTYNYLI